MLSKNFLSLFALTLLTNSCGQVFIPNTTYCAVSGVLSAGAMCVDTLNPKKPVGELSLYEFIEFLEPQFERPNPDNPTSMLPARGPAICSSSADFAKQKTAIEQACALLKKRGGKCVFEIDQTIKGMDRALRL